MHKTLLQKRVSVHLRNKLWYSTTQDERPTCPVCLDPLLSPKESCLLACSHAICYDCCIQGTLKKCPLCRA